MVHPDHDCEDCGKTHFAWSLHKEWADKNRKTIDTYLAQQGKKPLTY